MKQTLEFIPETHTYKISGEEQTVPSVSDIISSVFPFNGRGIAVQRACDFGTAVHACISLDIQGILDYESIDPAIKLHFLQWKIACEHLGIDLTKCQSEVMLYSKEHGFAGTIDLIANNFIGDYKTGGEYLNHRTKIAAYRALFNENYPSEKREKGMIFYLDGSENMPKVVEEQEDDFDAFLACKKIFDFKARNK